MIDDQPNTDPGMDVDMVELKALMAVMRREDRQAIMDSENEILSIVKSLGANGSKFKRERGKALRAVVSEIYSPPRVTKAASKLLPELGVMPGFALDLTTADVDSPVRVAAQPQKPLMADVGIVIDPPMVAQNQCKVVALSKEALRLNLRTFL